MEKDKSSVSNLGRIGQKDGGVQEAAQPVGRGLRSLCLSPRGRLGALMADQQKHRVIDFQFD